jgi:hypothetical protein
MSNSAWMPIPELGTEAGTVECPYCHVLYCQYFSIVITEISQLSTFTNPFLRRFALVSLLSICRHFSTSP